MKKWSSLFTMLMVAFIGMSTVTSCKKKKKDDAVTSSGGGGGGDNYDYTVPSYCTNNNINNNNNSDCYNYCRSLGNCTNNAYCVNNGYCNNNNSDFCNNPANYNSSYCNDNWNNGNGNWYDRYLGYFSGNDMELNIDAYSAYSTLRYKEDTYYVRVYIPSQSSSNRTRITITGQGITSMVGIFSNNYNRLRLTGSIRYCKKYRDNDYWYGQSCRSWGTKRIDRTLDRTSDGWSDYQY